MADSEMMLTNLDLKNELQAQSPGLRQMAFAAQVAQTQLELEDTISTYTNQQNDKV